MACHGLLLNHLERVFLRLFLAFVDWLHVRVGHLKVDIIAYHAIANEQGDHGVD